MSDPISFIGRIEELKKIKALVNDWGTTRILFIHGEGGVGKTRLLEEVRSRHSEQDGAPLLVAEIIDFDDRALRVIENIERQIMLNLGSKAFEAYSRKLHDWHAMMEAGVSAEELEKQRKNVHQTLVDGLNQVCVEHRVILLLDTAEKLETTNAWNQLLDLILQAKNTVFIFAGRRTKKLYETLCHDSAEICEFADLIGLEPLEPIPSQEYLAEKQHQLNITLDANLEKKLLRLTAGKPILIDLAVEWLSRNIPLDWLTTDIQSNKLPTEAELKQQQADFQVQLVAHIGDIRSQMDRLILLMSRVYPLDCEMIATSLNIPNSEAEALLKQAQTYVFVKSHPGGLIYLHDEMRRMIRDYVWPNIDPDGDRRQLDSRFAVEYLKPQIKNLEQKIVQFTAEEEQAREEGEVEGEFEAFVERQALEQERWAVIEQLLFHTLFTNSEEGTQLFIEIFTQATEEYQYSLREIFLEQMDRYISLAEQEAYLKPLSPAQTYEVDIRRAKFLLDRGQYNDAEKLLNRLLSTTTLQPNQQVDTRIQMANVVLRMGRFYDSIEYFTEAVNISISHGLEDWLVKAENGLGWAYRHIADREKAREHYETALETAKKLKLKHDQALLYSNLGFIYAYIPSERQRASSFCKASLRLWEELDDKRGKGRAYSSLGCVVFMDGQFDEALTHFQKALNIFEPVNDREWLSVVYSWRGAVYMSLHELDLAEKDLEQSLKMDVKKDKPMSLSRLGLIYMMQKKLEKAQEAVDECRSLALDLSDVLYQMVSIRDMARLARHKKEYSKLEIFEGYLNEYLDQWGYPQDRRALGMLYLNFGSLALGQSRIDTAIDYYKQGLEPLAELGRYGSDTVDAHIKRLEEVFVTSLHLDPEQIRCIGNALQSFWEEKGFDVIHPDVVIDFEKWITWEGA